MSVYDKKESSYPIDLSEKEEKVVTKWYNHYIDMRGVLDTPYAYFNDRSLVEYIDDSVKRFNGYRPPREGKYDWQAHVFSNATRNKTLALFAKMGLTRPEIKVQAIPKGDLPNTRLGNIALDAYKYSEIKSSEDMAYFFETLEAATKGTVISYEGYRSQYRKVRDITAFDPITGEMTFEEREIREYNDCFSEICDLDSFYIWNPYEPDIQKQARLIWKKRMPIDEFRYQFAKYPKAEMVKASNQLTEQDRKAFYKQDWTTELEANEVEVLYCFEKANEDGFDEMVIIANGVPIVIGAFPWKHKQYPFAKTVFEPFDGKFFWGNSLPNKMMADQDVLNTLYNMALDKTYLSIFPPILDSTINEIEDELLVPGRRMPVEDTNSMRELKISSVDSGHFNMLQMVSHNIDLSSVSEVTQGQAGSGSTAREVILAEENARRLIGLFNMFMEELVYQKAKLRIPNILQFYTIPEKIERLVGNDGVELLQQKYRTIRLESVELEEGVTGTRVVRLVDRVPMTPEQQSIEDNRVAQEEAQFQKREGTPLHIMEVPASWLRNLELEFQIVKGTGYARNKSTEMALGLEYVKMMVSMFPEMVNKEQLVKDLAELYDKDPEKTLLPPSRQMQPEQLDQVTPAGRGTGTTETVRNLAGRNAGGVNIAGGEPGIGDLSGV